MSNAKIASPLFILREICAQDLMGALEKLAGFGFDGVEFIGFFGHEPKSIREKLDSVGLRAMGNHFSFNEFCTNTEKTIEDHSILGCSYITISAPEPKGMPDGEEYAKTIQEMERIGAMMRSAGMKLLYHNHASEAKNASNGKPILENIMDDISPDALYLEPDLGWIKIGGGNPAHYLKKYTTRCPVIHFKDFYSDDIDKTATFGKYDVAHGNADSGNFEFRPTGYGIMNNAELYRLSFSCNPEWYVLDHDAAYERDPFADLKISLDYFKNLMKISEVI